MQQSRPKREEKSTCQIGKPTLSKFSTKKESGHKSGRQEAGRKLTRDQVGFRIAIARPKYVQKIQSNIPHHKGGGIVRRRKTETVDDIYIQLGADDEPQNPADDHFSV